MNDPKQALDRHLADLRESFDRSFALPQEDRVESRDAFLIVRAGGERYAIPLDAILGVQRDRKIVPLPLQVPGLLGLAGLRGQLTPVFSLASLVGGSTPEGASEWLAFCKGVTPIALAFEQFEASVQVLSQNVYATEPAERVSHLARQALRLDSGIVYVIDVPSAVAAAGKRLGRD